jgi:hypothetical protein
LQDIAQHRRPENNQKGLPQRRLGGWRH